MAVQFSSVEVQRLRQAQPALASPAQAKDRLQSMAAQLVDSRGGIKSGYLKLVNDRQGNLQLGTRWSRSADGSTQQATDMVKNLVKQAYGDNPAIAQALETYLQASGQRLGTQSFVKLVKTLDQVGGQAASPVLARARVSADARLDENAVGAGIKVTSHLEAAQSLQPRLPGATTPQARALIRAQMRQALDGAQPSLQAAPALQPRFDALAAQLQPQILPALPGLGADALQGSVQLHSLLEQAVSSGPVSAADRLAVLSQITTEERQHLTRYFDSTAMDHDLAALALHEAQAPGTGACAALQELRDCDTALRSMNGVPPPAPAAPHQVPAAVLAPLQISFDQWVEAMNSGHSHEGMSRFLAFLGQMNETSVNLAQAQQYKLKGGDEVQDMRRQLMAVLMSGLSDAEVAQALQLMRQSDVMGQLALGSDVLAKAGSNGFMSRYRVFESEVRLNRRISAAEAFLDTVVERALSARLRGHADLEAPSALALRPQNPLAEMSPEGKSRLWRSFVAEPVLSLAEFHATLDRSRTPPSDPALVPQWQAEKTRSSRIRTALESLQPLQGMDSARMVQLLMHPASRDRRTADQFILLMTSKAPALLALSRQQGRVPTDAQIWQTVLGEPVPADIQGLGSPDLGARLVKEARQRYNEVARAVHLAAGGTEESLVDKLRADPLMIGLIQGFTLERQIELIQHPDHPMTERDFHPATLQLLVAKNQADTAFGQTQDIHRWTPPTRFIFEGVGAAPAVLDPNAQPWQQGVSPPVDHPVIQDLSGHVQTLAAGRAAQTQAVLCALTQASTMVMRMAAEAYPGKLVTPAIEHGAYDFNLTALADGTVQIRITPNAPMRFDGELRLEVSPQGDIRTTGLRLLPRVAISPERWPQLQTQLQTLQDRLNDPSEQDERSVMSALQSLTSDLNQDLLILGAQPEGERGISKELMDEVMQALADVQFDMAYKLIDRNRLDPDPLAPQSDPDVQDLAHARQLLEGAMDHARGIGNAELLGRATELHDEAFAYPEVRIEQIDVQDVERGSMASLIRERAARHSQA